MMMIIYEYMDHGGCQLLKPQLITLMSAVQLNIWVMPARPGCKRWRQATVQQFDEIAQEKTTTRRPNTSTWRAAYRLPPMVLGRNYSDPARASPSTGEKLEATKLPVCCWNPSLT
jgi:hypothetical protein